MANTGNMVTMPVGVYTPMSSEQSRWIYYGYCDVADGLGFRKSYEECVEHIQRNYELGRSYAMAFKTEWGVVPKWKPEHEMHLHWKEALRDPETSAALNYEKAFHFKGVPDTKPVVKRKVGRRTHKRRVTRW